MIFLLIGYGIFLSYASLSLIPERIWSSGFLSLRMWNALQTNLFATLCYLSAVMLIYLVTKKTNYKIPSFLIALTIPLLASAPIMQGFNCFYGAIGFILLYILLPMEMLLLFYAFLLVRNREKEIFPKVIINKNGQALIGLIVGVVYMSLLLYLAYLNNFDFSDFFLSAKLIL